MNLSIEPLIVFHNLALLISKRQQIDPIFVQNQEIISP